MPRVHVKGALRVPRRSSGVQPDQVDRANCELDKRVLGPALRRLRSQFGELAVIAKIEVQARERRSKVRAARVKFQRFLGQRHSVREVVEGISIEKRETQVRTGR